MTASCKDIARASLAAALVLGSLAAMPAHAQTVITTGGSTAVGSSFFTAFGADGYLEFDTSAAGQTSGDYDTGGTHSALVANNGSNAASTTTIVQPGYVSGFTGFTVDHASGYGYDTISTGKEAGIVGGGSSSGGIFSFTVGNNAPANFQFGVLSNYTGTAAESPTTITLTGDGATPVSFSDTGTGATRTGTDFLFNVAGAVSGQTFTVSTNSGSFISGATFDSSPAASAAPEPSQLGMLALTLLGAAGLVLKARRRVLDPSC